MEFCITKGNNYQDIFDNQINLIREKINKKQIIIVPDNCVGNIRYTVLDKLGISATFNINVYSVTEFLNKFGSDEKVLSNIIIRIILQNILKANEINLLSFGKTKKSIAFAGVLMDIIFLLEKGLYSANELYEIIPNIKDDELKNKIHDIALIYQKYLDYLGENYLDINIYNNHLIGEICKDKELNDFDIYLCYFDSFCNQDYQMIFNLIKSCNSVNCGVLSAEEFQFNSYLYDNKIINRLNELATKIDLTLEISNIKCSFDAFRKQNLYAMFGYDIKKMNLDNNKLKLFEASSPYLEAEYLAKDIVSKIRTAKCRYKDINVCVTDLVSYDPIVKNIFEEYNIPYYIDEKFKLKDSEICKLVKSLINVVLDNFSKQGFLALVKNPLMNISIKESQLIENIMNKYAIESEAIFQNYDELKIDCEYCEYINIINTKLKSLKNFYENMIKSTKIKEYVENIENFFVEINIKENIQKILNQLILNSDTKNILIQNNSYQMIINLFDEFLVNVPEYEIYLEEFLQILNSAIDNTFFDINKETIDCVSVGQILQTNFVDKSAMYVLGAGDGNIPKPNLEVSLFTDNELNQLMNLGVDFMITVQEQNKINKLKVINDLSHAVNNLTISYPIMGFGEKNVESSLMLDYTKAYSFVGQDLPIVNLDIAINDALAFGERDDMLVFNLVNYENMLKNFVFFDNNTEDIKTKNTIKYILLQKGYNDILSKLLKVEPNPSLDESIAKKVFFKDNYARVTEMEKYFLCPYMHYLDYGLKLKERECSRIDSMTIGTILHAVLENFTRLLKNNKINDTNLQMIVEDIFEKIISRDEYIYFKTMGQNQIVFDSLKKESIRICEAICYQQNNSKYQIKYIEASFGDPNFVPIPEVAIINTDTKIKIKGKIDRVDYYDNKYRIVDYKTSKNSGTFKLLDFYLGKKIQLFYYAFAVVNGMKQKNELANIGAVLYQPLHREYSEESVQKYANFKMDGIVLDNIDNLLAQDTTVNFDNPKSEIIPFKISVSKSNVENDQICVMKNKANANQKEFNDMLEYSELLITKAINELIQGYILPKPIKNACDYCKYKSICRIQCHEAELIRSDEFDVEIKNFGGLKND